MTTRAEQREATRRRIVGAAIDAFAKQGFDGASTRAIAARADVTQGLLTYHFPSKDELWRAAADHIFDLARTEVIDQIRTTDESDPTERAREAVRTYVRFSARRPEVLRFMVDAGEDSAERRKWLVDTHLEPMFDQFAENIGGLNASLPSELVPHLFYVMVGAGSLIFALGDEVGHLAGLDVAARETVEAHADVLAALMVP